MHDKSVFFAQMARVLALDGHGVSLAPLKHVIYEGHIFLPFAHRFANHGALLQYIRLMSRMGLGKYREHRRELGASIQTYAERHADYIFFWTSYATEGETLGAARAQGLRADFRFSSEFYFDKLGSLLTGRMRSEYRFREHGFYDALAVKLLRYLSSVTLVCRKRNAY